MAAMVSSQSSGLTASLTAAAPSEDELRTIDAYWRACHYLAVGMIYLRDNPLLNEPLVKEHVKHRLLGHRGASPALSFTYIHCNRLIKKYDLDMIFMAGPGHGAPGVLGPVYLERTYFEIYHDTDKQKHLQYLPIDEAIRHCTKGLGVWDWASNDDCGIEPDIPDVVMACCEDIPTMESWAATAILREELPHLKVRFVNVVDLLKLVSEREHPHGLSDRDVEALFTPDKPVIFNFRGYPWLIHRLIYRRSNQERIHVRGYKEKGLINMPMSTAHEHGTDPDELVNWKWLY